MGFLEHLEELRKRIIIILLTLTITTGVSYIFAYKILSFILIPAGHINLVYLSPFEPFIVKAKLALFSGISLSLPIILYETIAFLAPAFTKKEKKMFLICLFSSLSLFVLGSFFSFFFVLPYALKWLFSQAEGYLTSHIRADYYITFVGWFMLVFGFVFETPLLIIALLKLKICTYKVLRNQWRIVYLFAFIISAIITPDWNPATMLFIAIPLILLYEATLFISILFKF